jgi:hypothetical protein
MASTSATLLTTSSTAAMLASRDGGASAKWRRHAVPRLRSSSARSCSHGTLDVKATTATSSSSSNSSDDARRRAGAAAVALSTALALGVAAPQPASAETLKDLYVAAGNSAFLEKEFVDLKYAGVKDVVPGLAGLGGGEPADPPVQAVKVTYDADRITHEVLMRTYWKHADPTKVGLSLPGVSVWVTWTHEYWLSINWRSDCKTTW